ncbi:MAG: hypothetical protein WCR52_14660 [Bacteroidota bacterium]
MTTRISSVSLIFLLALSISTVSAQTAAKTFSKSFNAQGKGLLRLDLPGAVDVKTWDSPTIRFEINVSLASGNTSMLNELANVGRYNLTAKSLVGEDVMIVNAPNLLKQVKIKGEILKEFVTYTVYVPKRMGIEMPNALSLAEVKK